MTAILNLRGRNENSGCSDDHCRRISAIGARIGDLVGGDAGEMVGGDVADAIARGLDRVHLDAGELGENVGRVLQRRPVELEVLPRGEMAVAAIVLARDFGELAHLARVQRAVGHGDAQHVGMELQIEAVHQPMRPELLLGQFAGEAARHLVAELARRARRRRRRRIRHSDTCGVSVGACRAKTGRLALRLLAEIAPHRRSRGADRLAQRLRRVMAVAQLDLDRIGVDDKARRHRFGRARERQP